MPKYPGISPYDNEKGTLGTAKKRWEKIYVKDIESDTITGMHSEIQNLATTAENSVANAVAAKTAAETAKTAAETAAQTAATAAAGIQSVVETDVDATLSIPGVAADAKVTGDWLNAIAKPVTGNTSLPGPCDEFLQYIEDAEHRLLFGIKRDGSVTWQKGVPQHVKDAMTPTMENDEYLYAIVDPEEHVLFAIKKDGTVDWQKGTPKHVQDKINELAAPTIDNDEYMYVMLDSESHVLFGVKKDGSFDWQKGLPKPVREKLEEIAQAVIQSDEYIQLTQDSEGKLIEGVTADGSKVFFSPVKFNNGIVLSEEAQSGLKEQLSGSLVFDYEKYVRTYLLNSAYTGLEVFYLDGNTQGMTKENKVNLKYRFRDTQGTCTCKWQGESTSYFPKKNFSLGKMSPSIDIGWGVQKKYVLKAEFADSSHARNIISAKLWGEIVKSRTPVDARLLALPNGGAVDGFPVMLVMNDEYQGLYNLNIPKDPWMFSMGDSATEAIIVAEGGSDFKHTVTKEQMLAEQVWSIEYVPDEDNPDWAVNSFNRMIQACIDSSGSNYRDTLEDYLDIESAIDYFILSALLDNYDGFTKNFLMSTYDGFKWFFTAYDLDHTFGALHFGTAYRHPQSTDFNYIQNLNRAFHLVYRYDTEAFKARYHELRDSVMSEDNILNKVSNYLAPIPIAVMNEESNMWPTTPGTVTSNASQIIDWYRRRVAFLDKKISEL